MEQVIRPTKPIESNKLGIANDFERTFETAEATFDSEGMSLKSMMSPPLAAIQEKSFGKRTGVSR